MQLKIALTVFTLAMVLYPAVQKKAQEEIDRVVGSTRLPTFADRASLPYVDALYREVLRWRPGAPLSFAHVTLKDDVYKGFHIPKGIYSRACTIVNSELVNMLTCLPERLVSSIPFGNANVAESMQGR